VDKIIDDVYKVHVLDDPLHELGDVLDILDVGLLHGLPIDKVVIPRHRKQAGVQYLDNHVYYLCGHISAASPRVGLLLALAFIHVPGVLADFHILSSVSYIFIDEVYDSLDKLILLFFGKSKAILLLLFSFSFLSLYNLVRIKLVFFKHYFINPFLRASESMVAVACA